MTDHYFSVQPSVPSHPSPTRLRVDDLDLELVTDKGVFSTGRVDPGTLALLRHSPAPPGSGHLLDLGCGYGAIACALARRAPGATVWAVDVNRRALDLVEANAKALGLANVRAAAPDDVPAGVVLAGLWSNPPVRVGKQALHDVLARWLGRLAPDARAWLVVHHHLGSDSLAAWLADQGWTVRRAASKSGYRVLEVGRAVS
jgi:16S rRNA (guanine1207-N2)-methyltransferase